MPVVIVYSKKSSRIRDFSFNASPEYAIPIEPRIKEHKYVISGHPCFENWKLNVSLDILSTIRVIQTAIKIAITTAQPPKNKQEQQEQQELQQEQQQEQQQDKTNL